MVGINQSYCAYPSLTSISEAHYPLRCYTSFPTNFCTSHGPCWRSAQMRLRSNSPAFGFWYTLGDSRIKFGEWEIHKRLCG